MVSPLVNEPGISIRGVLSLVMLSSSVVPRSDAVARSGADGVAGTTFNVPEPEEPEKALVSVGVKLAPIAYDPAVEGVYVMVARKLDGEKRNVLEVPISAPAT